MQDAQGFDLSPANPNLLDLFHDKILRKGKLSLEVHMGDKWRPVCVL
jgi:hypothetical protein